MPATKRPTPAAPGDRAPTAKDRDMIDVSALYGGLETPSTPHRYGRAITQIDPPEHQRMRVARSARERRPIVVWNLTRSCNLNCVHCYTDSRARRYDGELEYDDCLAVIEELASFGVPAVLFSGGEPLMHPRLFDPAAHARKLGLHVVLSTNGALITRDVAQRLKDLKFAYVGISLDSADADVHDQFRGTPGAFDRTMRGFQACVDVGQKVGLRLTLTRQTARDIDAVLDFIDDRGIDRACFYHLCPAGRGSALETLAHAESRAAVDRIFDRTRASLESGRRLEVLTVDNHCDGPYLYLRMLREGHPRAQQVLDMLTWNGGARYSSGVGIADIDPQGEVHADQFSMHRSFGNVKDKPFSRIWTEATDPVLAGLKDRLPRLHGRCAGCRFKSVCGGSLRARAEAVTGDPWASDPGCYLTDDEIAGTPIGVESST